MERFRSSSEAMTRRGFLRRVGWLASALAVAPRPAAPQAGVDARRLGLRCDGSVEERAMVQRAFDHAAAVRRPLMIPGPMRVAGPLRYRSNLTLVGQGGDAAIIANEPLGQAHLLSAAEPAAQANVEFHGLQFSGAGAGVPAAAALLRFGDTDRLVLSNCTFRDHGFALVGLFGCSGITISDCHFTRWGKLVHARQGGPALHVAAEPHSGRRSQQVEIARNRFDNGEWVALSIYGRSVSIHDNIIRTVRESGIWASRARDDPLSIAENLTIRNNVIAGVRQMDISATGIEVDVRSASITGNRVVDTDSSGLKVLGDCTDVTVQGNSFVDTVRKPSVFHQHAQILFQYNGAGHPARITIEENVVRDTAQPKIAPYAIGFPAWRGTYPIPALVVRNNDIRDGYAQAPALLPAGMVGPGSQIAL